MPFVGSCFLVIFLCGYLSAQYQHQGKCRNMITDKRRLSQGLATTHPPENKYSYVLDICMLSSQRGSLANEEGILQ